MTDDREIPVGNLPTIDAIIARARANLEKGPWDYARAGAGEEVTVRRNRAAFRRLAIVSRVLRDVSEIDTTTSVLGVDLAVPVIPAPVGSLSVFHPQAAAASAAGAHNQGTIAFVGTLSSPSFDEVQAASGGNNVFQLYVSGDDAWLDALLDRVATAGAQGLCVTVDSPVHARRDRLLHGGFDWRMERDGVPPNLEGLGRQRQWQSRFTWASLERLRSRVDMPIAVKGIMHADDARRAVDIGIDAIYVSNHGGRELDHSRGAIEVLSEIAGAVGDRAEILFDSGIRHGTDIYKALALGARAVLIGRLLCWGLAAGGAEGVARVLEILGDELRSTMAMSGASGIDDLHPGLITESLAV